MSATTNMNPDVLALGLLWYVVFLLSTTCHEAAHALVAKWGGDLTASHGGQVTLNPWPHIRREPIGMVAFPLISYFVSHWMMGWASAPYDPDWSRQYPRRAAKMALAGPAANFILALVAAIAILVGLRAHLFEIPDYIPLSNRFSNVVDAASPGIVEGIARFLSLLFSLNLLLAVFNLIPLPPLDGFSAIPILLNEDGGRNFLDLGERIRPFTFIGLVLGWQIFGNMFDPIFSAALKFLYRYAS